MPGAILALVLAFLPLPRPLVAQIEVTEATIMELQEAMASGVASSEEITLAYLARIAAYDRTRPGINSMLWMNADAVDQARALDAEREASGPRGPLHGIPVILKDNYGTTDMPTSAGSLALAGLMRPTDAFQVRRLREAGAVILGKSNMHELASGITTISSIGGQTLNPYDPTRNPGGSSGGTGAAIAASFAAVGWGSDTCGSIRIPAAQNDLFGLRPTKGLSSIEGIIPLAHTQDVGGPLARTVEDLAIALDATVGPDPGDPATSVLEGRELPRFVDVLDRGALDGARIGVLAAYWGDAAEDRAAQELGRAALARMAELGAEIVEDVEIPDLDSLIAGSSVIGHELKWDLLDYLQATPGAPVDSLGDILDSGLIHQALVGNIRNRNRSASRDTEEYRAALAKRGPLRDAVVAVLDALELDALAYPTLRRPPALIGEPQRGSSCQLSASTGMPALSAPAGFTEGLPIGIELLARPFDDARLVAIAFAFEQATDHRRTPSYTPPLEAGRAPAPREWEVTVGSGADAREAVRAPQAVVRFTWDPVMSTLGWEARLSQLAPSELAAVVLQRADDSGRWFVIEQVMGPGTQSVTGSLHLDPALREQLLGGEIHLELVTLGNPAGFGRHVVRPPSG